MLSASDDTDALFFGLLLKSEGSAFFVTSEDLEGEEIGLTRPEEPQVSENGYWPIKHQARVA